MQKRVDLGGSLLRGINNPHPKLSEPNQSPLNLEEAEDSGRRDTISEGSTRRRHFQIAGQLLGLAAMSAHLMHGHRHFYGTLKVSVWELD
ncbi:MAG: hypothetical protein QOD42_923 [Sphingomonadales bacterium]|nr:hypothetical protein [Sphingomonadales bacterium]